MKKYILYLLFITIIISSSLFAANEPLVPEDFIPASDTFVIKKEKPDVVILADTLTARDGIITLDGRVKATRQNDILNCNRALISNKPQWILATIRPSLFRKESIIETRVVREMNITAKNIYINRDTGLLSASDTVVVSIDETTWDLATHTRVIITSDDLIGREDSERLIFSGNVKIYEPEGETPSNGKGNRLDYLRKRSLAVLSSAGGDALINTWELNPETNQKEKRSLKGKRIIYNTLTKEGISE